MHKPHFVSRVLSIFLTHIILYFCAWPIFDLQYSKNNHQLNEQVPFKEPSKYSCLKNNDLKKPPRRYFQIRIIIFEFYVKCHPNRRAPGWPLSPSLYQLNILGFHNDILFCVDRKMIHFPGFTKMRMIFFMIPTVVTVLCSIMYIFSINALL